MTSYQQKLRTFIEQHWTLPSEPSIHAQPTICGYVTGETCGWTENTYT